MMFIKPVITEKSMNEAGKRNYTFVVPVSSRKEAIKKTIEKQFGVTVTGITSTTRKGKTKRVGQRRTKVDVMPVKKVSVMLKEGQTINLFSLSE